MQAEPVIEIRCFCCGKWAEAHPWFEDHPKPHALDSRRCFDEHMHQLCCKRQVEWRRRPPVHARLLERAANAAAEVMQTFMLPKGGGGC